MQKMPEQRIKRSSLGAIRKSSAVPVCQLPLEPATLVSEVGWEDLQREIQRLEKELASRGQRESANTAPDEGSRTPAPGLLMRERELSPVPNVQASSVMPRGVKLPGFNGSSPWEPYRAQMTLIAQHSGWTEAETAMRLVAALEGPALQTLLDLNPNDQGCLQALVIALERRFGRRESTELHRKRLANRRRQPGESWGAVAADLRHHAHLGYPNFGSRRQDELALHAFLQSLTPERLRHHVVLTSPSSLDEALQEAERAADVMGETPPTERMKPHHRVHAVDCSEEEGEVRWTRALPNRQHTPTDRPDKDRKRCYRCDEQGHIARYCPAPAPKHQRPQPSGNEPGVAQ